MKIGVSFTKYFLLHNQCHMVNTEGLTAEQIAEIETLKQQAEEVAAQKAALEEKNKELGDKIYKLKKENKNSDNSGTWLTHEDLDRFYEEKEFFTKNPHLVEHKDKIKEFTSKGISFEVAKLQVEMSDPTIQNRANTQKANFTNGETNITTRTYTQEELSKLPMDEFKKVVELSKKGEVKIV